MVLPTSLKNVPGLFNLPGMFLLFSFLQFVDWFLTTKLLSLGGIEQNPIMLFLYSQGIILPLIIKIIGIILIFIILRSITRRSFKAGFLTLSFITFLYILIVVNNTYWYLQLR